MRRGYRALRCFVVVLTFLGLAPPMLSASELLHPGVLPKLSAGSGQTVSRGPSALFYNPANILYIRFFETEFDLSVAQIHYTYQHPDKEKYGVNELKVTAPPVTLGLGLRPTPNFAIALAILPLGKGDSQTIKGVPLELTPGTFQEMDVVSKSTQFKLAIGAAFRFSHLFTVGLGMILDSEKQELSATPPGNEEPFLDARYAATASQIAAGIRSELLDRSLAIALSYKTPATKKYKGDLLILTDPETSDYVDFTGVGYTPSTIGVGGELRLGGFGAFADVTIDQWSQGRTIAKKGYGQEATEVDYINATNFALGVKFWPAPAHMVTAAFGNYASNTGFGTTIETSEPQELAESSEGVETIRGSEFGKLEQIPRMVIAGGYRMKLDGSSGFLAGGGQYQSGKRSVSEGYSQPGEYSLNIMMLTFGIGYGF